MVTNYSHAYEAIDEDGTRRLYVRESALTDDPRENGRLVKRVMQVCYQMGGGVVMLPPGLFDMQDTDEIPNGVTISGSEVKK